LKLQKRFLISEIRAGARQLALYLLCVWCAVTAVATVGGWRESVDRAMAADARENAGGDIVAFSTVEFSKALLEALEPFHGVRTIEMFTVAVAGDRTLFCKLKAVEPGYPLYGKVPLASGGDLLQALEGGLVVEQKVLDRLSLHVGDRLKVGLLTLPVVDVALSEPDRPLGIFGVSPRIFVSSKTLPGLGLTRKGSYAERRVHILLPDREKARQIADELREKAVPDQERVETWQRPPVNMRNFVDNFFTFLDMIAVFAVALGGLGMQATLTAWLRERRSTLAVVRTLGASQSFIFRHYAAIAALVTAPGIALGLATAVLALRLSGAWLVTLLPVRAVPHLPLEAAGQAVILGVLISVGFTLLPLWRLRDIRPAMVLRNEDVPLTRRRSVGLSLALLGTTFALLLALLHNLWRAVQFSLGLALLFALVAGLTSLALRGLGRLRPRSLALRLGLRGIQAPGAATRAVVTILGASLAVLFCVGLIELALDGAWVQSLPVDAPNLIFFDIQPAQAKGFRASLGLPARLYPSLRARIQDVDGKPLPRLEAREYWEHDARREFVCTSRNAVDEDEEIAEGGALFAKEGGNAQVSVSDKVAKMAELKIGSKVTFTIQGVPVEATVSSIRHAHKAQFRPFYDFVFVPELVSEAPQTIYATARVPEALVGEVQTRLARAFPSITSMDVSLTIRLVAVKVTQMVGLIRFFMLAGALAGTVILISASLSTRLSRMRESAYFKVLGATRAFVSRVLLWENALLGLLSSTLGLALGCLAAWGICRWQLEVDFPIVPGTWAAMLAAPTLLVTLLGWGVSRSVIQARPAPFLREDA